MADREDTRPDFNPKHRIVGAIVIVSIAVIFLPMILSEREPPSELKSASAVPRRTEVAETRVVITPVPGEEMQNAAPKTEIPAPVPEKPVAETAPKPELKPAAPAERAVTAKKPEAVSTKEETAKPAATEKISKGWMVQVGLFTNAENAMRLRDRLKSHGHSVSAETVTLEGRKAVRLRVGPFRDKAQATKVQAQIHKETGVRGAVQAP